MSEDWLIEAAGDDPARLAVLRARVAAGEPAAYAAGFLRFRGHRFRSDPRAYITDPELSALIDLVLEHGDAAQVGLGRPLRVLDFGTGAGTLGISVQLERPHWELFGIDLDERALQLAAENADLHGVPMALATSSFLSGWPEAWPMPDLIFADPPWGSEADLYADPDRDAAYYHRMPPASAYPQGGRTAIHDELLRQLAAREWRSTVLLNYGVLPEALILESASPLSVKQLIRRWPGLSVLIGRWR